MDKHKLIFAISSFLKEQTHLEWKYTGGGAEPILLAFDEEIELDGSTEEGKLKFIKAISERLAEEILNNTIKGETTDRDHNLYWQHPDNNLISGE